MQYFEKGSKSELLYWATRLYSAGMTPGTSGNISIKTNEGILISGTGTCLGDMDESDMGLIDIDGNQIEGKKASSEKFLHTQIYAIRNDIGAVLHAHCPYITAFAVAHKEMDEPILPEFIFNFGKIKLAKYALPSTHTLAENVSKIFLNSNAALMENHGVVVASTNAQKAFYDLESIQALAKTYIMTKIIGKPHKLSPKDVQDIHGLKL